MLRYLRRAVLVFGLIIATAFGTAPANATSVNLYSSSDEETSNLDLASLLNTAIGFAASVEAVRNGEVTPEVKTENGAVNIILDPRSIPGIAEIIDSTPSPWNDIQTGQTSDGRKVVFPTTGRFTSGFGPRWGAMHQGIDIANNIGTPIYSVMAGTVTEAGAAQGFGQWVRVKHDNGEYSVYGHVESFNVSIGQRVEAGQQIATMGNRGRSTGPHLHFEIRPDGVNAVDPVAWFAVQGINVNR